MMSISPETEEREIIRLCLEGESEQYAVLVDRYKAMAYNIAYRMLGDADAAKDMSQESFISAYASLEKFQYGSKFSSWLYRIVVNKCKDRLRAEWDTVQVDEISDIVPSRERTPEQTASSRQTGDAVQKALNSLPDEYREVIVLKHIEGLDYREIADILGVSVNALKVRAHRGREMLKELLQEMGDRV
ncbi:MAG: sigma-70 family RNA polymerase sigma factor [Nitrospirota bacterium]